MREAYNTKQRECIVEYLKDCGMSDDDIGKVGDYKGWFHLNPLFNEKEDDLKGKGKNEI